MRKTQAGQGQKAFRRKQEAREHRKKGEAEREFRPPGTRKTEKYERKSDGD